jgi:threonine/homoserine/homoserine lactone efflux protein
LTGLLPPLVLPAAVGFAVSVGIGPVALLCIRRALARGVRAGLGAGLGAAAADALSAALAASGLARVDGSLAAHGRALRVCGGLLLLGIGVGALLRRARPVPAPGGGPPLFAAGFVLTVSNPITWVGTAGLLAGLAPAGAGGAPLPASLAAAGVFAGAATWWFLLSAAAAGLGERVTAQTLGSLGRACAVLILGLGLATLLSGLAPEV